MSEYLHLILFLPSLLIFGLGYALFSLDFFNVENAHWTTLISMGVWCIYWFRYFAKKNL